MNLPNKISVSRILSIPIFLVLLQISLIYNSYKLRFIAAVVFIIISLSDMLDGYIARKKNMVTKTGMILDPIADKLLMFSAMIFLTNLGIPPWITFIMLVRELLIVGLRTIVGENIVLPASKLGKAKTFFVTIGILMLLFMIPYHFPILIIGMILSVVSGYDYWVKLRQVTSKVRVWKLD